MSLVVEYLDPSLLPELQDLMYVSESEHVPPSGAAANTNVDTFAQSFNQLAPEMIDLVISRLNELQSKSPKVVGAKSSSDPLPVVHDTISGPHTSFVPPTSSVQQSSVPPAAFMAPPTPTMITQIPRIPCFSGDASAKGELSFQRFKYEVQSLLHENCPTQIVLQSIRRALKGTAADVVSYVPLDSTTPSDIIDRLDGLFGDVLSGEDPMQKFYNESQQADESVANWSCRLESILNKAIQGGKVLSESKDQMLRSKFWNDLFDERVKSATRHCRERHTNYQDMCITVRKIEQEINDDEKRRKKSGRVHHHVSTAQKSSITKSNNHDQSSDTLVFEMQKQIQALSNQLHQLTSSVTELKKQNVTNPTNNKSNLPRKHKIICYKCGDNFHTADKCTSTKRISREQVSEIKRQQQLHLNQ